jgi:transposase-like protein
MAKKRRAIAPVLARLSKAEGRLTKLELLMKDLWPEITAIRKVAAALDKDDLDKARQALTDARQYINRPGHDPLKRRYRQTPPVERLRIVEEYLMARFGDKSELLRRYDIQHSTLVSWIRQVKKKTIGTRADYERLIPMIRQREYENRRFKKREKKERAAKERPSAGVLAGFARASQAWGGKDADTQLPETLKSSGESGADASGSSDS